MERSFLEKLDLGEGAKLSKDAINAIMSEHGKDIEKKNSAIEALKAERDGLSTQLSEANKTIKSYTDMDVDSIKKSAADWEKKYNDDTAALKQQLADREREFNEELFLRGYKFSSKAAENGVRAEFRNKKFQFEDGKFVGAKEYMEKLMADDDYKAAFVSDAPKAEPKPQQPKPQFSDPTPQQNPPKTKLSLTELMRKKNENPNMEVNFD